MHIHRLEQPEGRCGQVHHDGAACQLFHYVKGKNVAVIDCDYPQFSIQALRSRDMKNVERSEFLQQLLCRQYERTGKKAYPVLTSGPARYWKQQTGCRGTVISFSLICPER